MSAIPSIDFLRARTERELVAAQLVQALETVGFLYLDNIEGYKSDELLDISKWFFAFPAEKKRKVTRRQWNPENPNIYRGYYPLVPNAVPVSNKEAIEFGNDIAPDDYSFAMYESNCWPDDDGSNFKATIQKYHKIFSNAAIEVLRLLALGMGLEEHHFDEAFLNYPLSTLRLLHYPPRTGEVDIPQAARDGDKILQCSDHQDFSFMTLLATFEYTGLEILDGKDQWVPVEPRPQSLVMNIGKTLSHMSGNRFKATRHRVVDPGVDRYSVPFFVEPYARIDINVPLHEFGKAIQRPSSHQPILYGNWIVKYISQFYEYRDTDFGPELV